MKLTEQQRAYMFANWPKVSDTPWNKVDLNGPLASQLAAMKKLARAAHPTAPAAQPRVKSRNRPRCCK